MMAVSTVSISFFLLDFINIQQKLWSDPAFHKFENESSCRSYVP
jgi:hypothetical protein